MTPIFKRSPGSSFSSSSDLETQIILIIWQYLAPKDLQTDIRRGTCYIVNAKTANGGRDSSGPPGSRTRPTSFPPGCFGEAERSSVIQSQAEPISVIPVLYVRFCRAERVSPHPTPFDVKSADSLKKLFFLTKSYSWVGIYIIERHLHTVISSGKHPMGIVTMASASPAQFGKSLRDQFLFDQEWLNLNNGELRCHLS